MAHVGAAVSPNDEEGGARNRRTGSAHGFVKVVIKKRKGYPPRQFVVACCFGCAALIGCGERNWVSLFWGDGDPGNDEVVVSSRETVVRMCRGCRMKLDSKTGLDVRVGGMLVSMALDECNEKSKTGAHGILRARVVRRFE